MEQKNVRPISPDFFIIGTPKSGTTWVWECINYHPELFCFNEIDLHLNLKGAFGSLLNKANMIYGQTKNTTFAEFNYEPHQFDKSDLTEITNTLWKNAIARAPKDAKMYGEKNPPYTSRIEEMATTYPNAKFIHIVRDPRDVAISFRDYMHTEKYFFESHNNKSINTLSEHETGFNADDQVMMMNSVTGWKKDQLAVETVKQRFSGRVYTIRYEDMTDPSTINGAFSFLGVKTSVEMCEMILQITDVEKRTKSPHSFFKRGKSGGHKDLGHDFVQYIEKIVGEQMEHYKYTQSNPLQLVSTNVK